MREIDRVAKATATPGICRVELPTGAPIEGTPIHPFWEERQQRFVPMGELRPGDLLATPDGPAPVQKVSIHAASTPVYNIEVENQHVYRIGQQAVLVHNSNPEHCTELVQIDGVPDTKTYQTYTKTNPHTGEIYTGRTSGTATPRQNIARRDANHHKNGEGFGPAQLDKSSKNKDAIRGREQLLIDANGGAISQGGTSGNRINGISSQNPKLQQYLDAAISVFGG